MKNIRIILFSSFLSFILLYPQNKSIHQKNWEEKKAEKLTTNKVEPFRIFNSKNQKLSKTVFGYLPDWEYVSQSSEYLRLDLLTHIAIFGFTTDGNGNLENPLAWPWTNLITQAHNSNVKMIMTVISFDSDIIHQILVDENTQSNLISNIISIIQQNNLDGVNIDFENVYEEDRNDNFVGFLQNLKNSLENDIELSFASPGWNWGGWNFQAIAETCDYLFLMEYDYYGEWSESSGPSAPLIGDWINITRSINEQYANIDKSKLILGIPYYGNHWETANLDENADILRFINSPRYRDIKSGFDWNSKKWSDYFSNSFFSWQENNSHQIWYDSKQSLEEKYDFAISQNMKGIGIWALGFDGNRTELWDLINQKFGNGQIPKPEPPIAVFINPNTKQLIFDCDDESATNYLVYFYQENSEVDSLVTTKKNVDISGILQNEGTYYFYVKSANSSGNSNKSTTVAIKNGENFENLVIDGFDNYYGNNNNFNYVEKFGNSANFTFASTNNEAVIRNYLSLDDYMRVFWFVGNEDRGTETFNFLEQQKISDYIELVQNFQGKHAIFINGSEIGYDLADTTNWATLQDLTFFENVLAAKYVSDSPFDEMNTHFSFSSTDSEFNLGGEIFFDDGNYGTYSVLYPDIIQPNNSSSIFQINGISSENGICGISRKNVDENFHARFLLYSTIPFETIRTDNERDEFISALYQYFDFPISVEDNTEIPLEFKLSQNYPNPFNPNTTISYQIPQNSFVNLKIYDVLGNEIATLVNEQKSAGKYKVKFELKNLSSGVYFYKIQANNFIEIKKMILIK